MRWWQWSLVGLAVLLAVASVLVLPSLLRYLKIRRM
jgi:membrane protein YdbS with pleckstrin-like domain